VEIEISHTITFPWYTFIHIYTYWKIKLSDIIWMFKFDSFFLSLILKFYILK